MITRWGKFDPERTFVARKTRTIGGTVYTSGEVIDKAVVPPRRLRQLFDAKVFMYGEEPKPSILDMTHDERRAWFEAKGGKYDARWSDARVIEAASGLA